MIEKPKNKHPGGRPRVDIDWKAIDYYLKCQATQAQICNLLGVGVSTLQRACLREKKCSFDQYASKKREAIKQLIIGKQIDMALSGNVTMLIWCGKQFCSQSDKVESAPVKMEFIRKYETRPRSAPVTPTPSEPAPGETHGNA